MPTNISYGNTARFVVEFFDTEGALTVPSSATLTVNYVDRASLTATSTDIGLSLTNSFFLGTWSSTGASLGLAVWSVSAPDMSSAASGVIRVFDPDDPDLPT